MTKRDKKLEKAEQKLAKDPTKFDRQVDLWHALQAVLHETPDTEPSRVTQLADRIVTVYQSIRQPASPEASPQHLLPVEQRGFLTGLDYLFSRLVDVDRDRARQVVSLAIELAHDVVHQNPEDTEQRSNFAARCGYLANDLTRINTDDAENMFRLSIDSYQKLVTAEPGNTTHVQRLSDVFLDFGLMVRPTNPTLATELLERCVQGKFDLIDADPTDATFAGELCIALETLAKHVTTANPGQARAALEHSVKVRERLVEAAPNHPDMRDALHRAQTQLATVPGLPE